MPIAAVPFYLGTDFSQASPGMRFGMYLKLWGIDRRSHNLLWQTHDIHYEVRGQERQERAVRYENKVTALSDARGLNGNDKKITKALLDRQRHAFKAAADSASGLCLETRAVAPFTTGLGNEHPLENGFAFLNPYGLPYLPGSGVKGVLRQAARELASGEWGDTHGWSHKKDIPLMQGNSERRKPVLDKHQQPVMLSMLDVLFGRETAVGDSDHVRGALSFWDVIPQIAGDSLAVEIMTPHQSHYYQQSRDRKSGDSTTPHESGQPNPISFLTVPPGTGFVFHVLCDTAHLARLAPELAQADESGKPRWKTLLEAAFAHAFQWLGFGAKTAVGYGAMQLDAPLSVNKSQGGSASSSPVPVEEIWPQATLQYDPGRKEITASYSGKSTRGTKNIEPLFAALGAKADKLKNKKKLENIAVRVQSKGSYFELSGVPTETG